MLTKNPKPLDIYILFKPRKVEERTKGGIYIPSSEQEKQSYGENIGEIIDMGLSCFGDWREKGLQLPQIGDTVMTSKYPGLKIFINDELHYLMGDHCVLAIVEKKGE